MFSRCGLAEPPPECHSEPEPTRRRARDDDQFGCVSRRGNVEIVLREGSQGCAATWIYISVSDVDALFDEYSQKGVRIRRSPVSYPWGAREMHEFDLDGHVLNLDRCDPWGAMG